jgi:UDP-3-O-[3-hydroxymyristoyl] N-acetylglucosamine deacetylase
MLLYQRTLRDDVRLEGTGLHTGYPVHLRLTPAPAGMGIIFRRTDLRDFEIEATRAHVTRVSYATTLMKKGVMISTVEHLLSALYGLGVDNLYIDLDSMEVPIMDGSGRRFMEEIDRIGIQEQDALRQYMVIEEPIEVRHGEKFAGVYPSCDAGHIHHRLSRDRVSGNPDGSPPGLPAEIGCAWTFGFMSTRVSNGAV